MSLAIAVERVEEARAGGSALERLIEAVWPEAYRIALGILRDRGLAEDTAQEACASIARSLSTLKNSAGFAAWCYRIVVNRAIGISRARPPAQPLETLAARAGPSADRSDALDIDRALATLPVVQRAIVLLHYYAGLRSADIAEATGLPASTIRYHLMLARRALQRALAVPESFTLSPSNEVLTNGR